MRTSLKEFEESEAEFRLLGEGKREAYENLSSGMQLPEQLVERRIAWLMSGDRKLFFRTQNQIPIGYVKGEYLMMLAYACGGGKAKQLRLT